MKVLIYENSKVLIYAECPELSTGLTICSKHYSAALVDLPTSTLAMMVGLMKWFRPVASVSLKSGVQLECEQFTTLDFERLKPVVQRKLTELFCSDSLPHDFADEQQVTWKRAVAQ